MSIKIRGAIGRLRRGEVLQSLGRDFSCQGLHRRHVGVERRIMRANQVELEAKFR